MPRQTSGQHRLRIAGLPSTLIKAMAAVAGTAQRAGRLVVDIIVQRHAYAVVLRDRCFDSHGFAEFRHGFVLAGDLHAPDRCNRPLQCGRSRSRAARADPRAPPRTADVVRVVDDAHAIGFIVLDFVLTGVHKTLVMEEVSCEVFGLQVCSLTLKNIWIDHEKTIHRSCYRNHALYKFLL